MGEAFSYKIFRWIIFCWMGITLSTEVFPAADEKVPDVLLISSYSPIKESGNHIISSFIETLESRVNVRMSVEYLDSEADTSFASWSDWMHQMFAAYKTPPDVVVLLGGEAWSAYRYNCLESWREIPVVLGGVKNAYINYEDTLSFDLRSFKSLKNMTGSFDGFHVTGYYFIDDLEKNIQLIKRLEPQVGKIAFCYDNRYSFSFVEEYVKKAFENKEGIEVCYLPGDRYSTSQLLDSIASMDDSYALLSAGWYTDINHYTHAYSMFQNELSRYTSKTIFQLVDQGFLSENYIGGYFVTGKELGSDLAGLVGQVITQGIAHAPAFRQTPSMPRYHINYPALQRAGIDKRLLPSDVVYHNVPSTLFEEHPLEVIFALVTLVLLVGLFGLILYYRKRKEKDYKTVNVWLMKLLEAMPDMAVLYDTNWRVKEVINPQQNVLLGFDKEEIIGLHVSELGKRNAGFLQAASVIAENLQRTAHTHEVISYNYEVVYNNQTYYSQSRTLPFGKGYFVCFIRDITPQVMAEKKVLKLQTFLQSIVNNLPVGLFVKDVTDNYRYIFYNDRMADFYGDLYGYQLGKNDLEVNDPEAELFRQEDIEVAHSDHPLTFERIVYDRETGLPCRWGLTTKNRLLNNDGSCYIIAVLTDTTEIRKKEFELENYRRQLSLALEAGSMSAWLYDVDKQSFTSLYNRTVSEDGMTLEQGAGKLHPEDHEKYFRFIDELSSGECEKKSEIFRFDRGNGYGFFETYSIGIRSDRTGRVIQIIGTEKNITEEVAKQRELNESKSKLELAFESARIIPWEYEVSTRQFSSLNPKAVESAGISLNEYVEYLHPEDADLMIKGISDIIEGLTDTINIQIRVTFPGKQQKWYELHGIVSERDGSNHVERIIGLRRDITALKMTDELIELRNKAEEANRLKSAFLANMSHEIRTPLNAIVGFSALIGETEDREEIREYIEIIQTNNDLLLQLISDILDLSKIEAGQMDFRYSDFELSSLFRDLEKIYQPKVKKGVELICDLPEEPYIIHSEKVRLTQVLSNFLSNACKFTFRGTICMGYKPLEEGLYLYVKDTGKGIAPENMPYVFQRFAKFDSFVQGTGLGLSISQSIVQHLQGEIGVNSEVGKGSEFWFTLPHTPNLPG